MVGREKPLPAANDAWRFLPMLCGLAWFILLLVVDPILAYAPWWSYFDFSFWFALAIPLIPWLGLAGLMTLLGFTVHTRLSRLLLSLTSLAMGSIPSIIWTLLLSDVFAAAGSLQLTVTVSLFSGALGIPLSLIVLGRTLGDRSRKSRIQKELLRSSLEGQIGQ